jgi:hypothetical protein
MVYNMRTCLTCFNNSCIITNPRQCPHCQDCWAEQYPVKASEIPIYTPAGIVKPKPILRKREN